MQDELFPHPKRAVHRHYLIQYLSFFPLSDFQIVEFPASRPDWSVPTLRVECRSQSIASMSSKKRADDTNYAERGADT